MCLAFRYIGEYMHKYTNLWNFLISYNLLNQQIYNHHNKISVVNLITLVYGVKNNFRAVSLDSELFLKYKSFPHE
jgi:hypothetical protein